MSRTIMKQRSVMVDPGDAEIRFAPVSAGLLGDNTLVDGVAGKKIRLMSITIVATMAVSAQFKSAGNNRSGLITFAANGNLQNNSPYGLMETDPGDSLVLNMSVAAGINGFLSYVLI